MSAFYELTVEQVKSLKKIEEVWGARKFFPDLHLIPEDFLKGNRYTELVEAILYSRPMPGGQIVLVDGLEPEELNRFTHAYLACAEHRVEDKIAGVGFMLSKLMAFVGGDDVAGSERAKVDACDR